MLRNLAVLLLTLLATHARAGGYVFEYSDNCNNAYHHYLSLHFDEGRASVMREIRTNPYNLMATYISDYEDYILLMLNSDKEDFEQRKSHLDTRLNLLENGDKNSPWYRFCRAGIYLHWTVIYLRFGEHLKAANLFRKSYSLLNDNRKQFPDFEYNVIFTGIEEAVVGSLPGNYKWIASIMGIKGSVKNGIEKLNKFVTTHTDKQPFHLETKLYYEYTRFYFMAQQKEAWAAISSSQYPVENNLLNAYFRVYLGIDYNKSDDVIATINTIAHNKDYDRYPFFNFQMGIALLTRLDSNCVGYFYSYLNHYKGDAHVKDAWLKMAYYWHIAGQDDKAEYCRKQIDKVGSTELDVDKNAQKYYDNKTLPDRRLLKVRMLLDGGYYNRAFDFLKEIDINTVAIADKAEYYYRLGRVYEESGESSKAQDYFTLAVNMGSKRKEQFGARAALHKGKLYEHQGDKTNALKWYQEALDMPSHDFQNSIDQQAKAGINRIEDKL